MRGSDEEATAYTDTSGTCSSVCSARRSPQPSRLWSVDPGPNRDCRSRAAAAAAVALALADGSIVALALPDILGQFDVEIPTVAWVLTSYNLVLALAAVPAALLARRRARLVGGVGIVVFALASLACAVAPISESSSPRGASRRSAPPRSSPPRSSCSPRRSRRTRQRCDLGARGDSRRGARPGTGGVVTQVLGWEWIFALQVPAALVSLAALRSVSVRRAPAPSRERPDILMNAALLLISAALAAALFLLVLLLVNGWRLEPAAAGIVVTVMPLAAILAAPLARRIEGLLVRAAAGAILISGGLAALGLLPRAGWLWTVPPQVLIGVGLGLTLSALTERALRTSVWVLHGGWTIASRRAGVVLGLLLLTPLFTAALDRNQDEALAAGTAAVLDSGIPPLDKLRVAQDVLTEVERAEGRMPDVAPAFEGHDEPAYRSLKALVDQLDARRTRSPARSCLELHSRWRRSYRSRWRWCDGEARRARARRGRGRGQPGRRLRSAGRRLLSAGCRGRPVRRAFACQRRHHGRRRAVVLSALDGAAARSASRANSSCSRRAAQSRSPAVRTRDGHRRGRGRGRRSRGSRSRGGRRRARGGRSSPPLPGCSARPPSGCRSASCST